MENLDKIYKRRFSEEEIVFKRKMYELLYKDFLQKYISTDAVVLDLGAGYCSFINNIKAKRKIAVDLNPDVRKFADSNVEVIIGSSVDMHQIDSESIDVVFTSNFLEHLSKEDIVKTLKEVYRVLKKGGKFLIIQPNIRYCYRDYWQFFDHISPLDDRSLVEILETNGFKIFECRPKFLPYTIKSKLPKSLFFLRLYLRVPLLQKIFGAQAFIYSEK
ncbi:MAG: class I SAM-dependent methyltransferase [Candidatus Omnitrophica bacterium]|nr:class I SAM-dependent methyltransferase [Candidatus Omnitrophota bacterium]MCM8799787.1 class I SAM-dependent methyltransferase [Candidatus Omnitrophota bacterium]